MFSLLVLRLPHPLRTLLEKEDAQDLVEYALVVALIAFGATIGMHSLSTGIVKAFNAISTTLGTTV